MKLTISDSTKHKLVGLMVLISFGVIFLPAMLKKSNQNFERNIRFALKLPPKPNVPRLDIATNKEMFKTVKIAVPPVISVPKVRSEVIIARASAIETRDRSHPQSVIAKVKDLTPIKVVKPIEVVKAKEVIKPKVTLKPVQKPKPTIARASNKNTFSIQVATFTKQNNADILVSKLLQKGYSASYNKNGNLYRVLVGKVNERDDALILQKKLVANMRLNGFIVKVGAG